MDPRPRPSETELLPLLGEVREDVDQAEAPAIPSADSSVPTIGQTVAGRGRKRFEGALPLEDFLREISDPS